ncbi:hypothetical protein M426DRAFT_264964 [Hypoxylon sp. CI-4A]|nr:hypothetical protein M426DRAFT_264964 [Hypoxylon sp. CI-4A]
MPVTLFFFFFFFFFLISCLAKPPADGLLSFVFSFGAGPPRPPLDLRNCGAWDSSCFRSFAFGASQRRHPPARASIGFSTERGQIGDPKADTDLSLLDRRGLAIVPISIGQATYALAWFLNHGSTYDSMKAKQNKSVTPYLRDSVFRAS